MSPHSYTRVWLHLIWGTLNREKSLLSREARKRLSRYLYDYAAEKEIYMKINYVNPDHVHALIDLPTSYSMENIFQLLKGSSSTWVNRSDLLPGKFSWGRGYGAFSASHSNISEVAAYIANQEEHHRKKSFTEEYEQFLKAHGVAAYKPD